MTRETDERARETTIERAGRKRRDARDLDRTVEGLVVVAEALVVRSVPGLVDVQNRDDEPGFGRIAADAARRLDVLRVALGLAEDDHQPEPGDVEPDGD